MFSPCQAIFRKNTIQISFLNLLFLIMLLISLSSAATATSNQLSPLAKKQVEEFVNTLQEKHSLNKSKYMNLLRNISIQSKALNLVKPGKEKSQRKKSWDEYRKNFINRENIRHGKKFLQTHKSIFKKSYEQFGIPSSIIAAIIGVETKFGKYQGTYPVLDTLATLAFENSGRKPFFKKELENLILLSLEQKFRIKKLKSSYAGALGIPQFMPSSWREFAIDFNKDGKTDLINSYDDAIGSIANYLIQHGWKHGIATHSKLVKAPSLKPEKFFTYRLKAEFRLEELLAVGLREDNVILSPHQRVSVIDLELKNKNKVFWLATDNFFAITMYNRSYMYAAAVVELAQSLERQKL